jgi:hypothetical protein
VDHVFPHAWIIHPRHCIWQFVSLRDVEGKAQASPGQVALPGVPQGECGTKGRQAVPLRPAQLVRERKVIDVAKDPQ